MYRHWNSVKSVRSMGYYVIAVFYRIRGSVQSVWSIRGVEVLRYSTCTQVLYSPYGS